MGQIKGNALLVPPKKVTVTEVKEWKEIDGNIGEVNEYLKKGWTLCKRVDRCWDNEKQRHFTKYILGRL